MCVLIASLKFPTKEFLEASMEGNPDGIGIAYWTPLGVKYKKGIKFDELLKIGEQFDPSQSNSMLIHFRKSTVGAAVPQLCHPFPVSKEEDLNNIEGTAKVVFAHNGSVTDWRNYITSALGSVNKLPSGEHWSDTKALAFCLGAWGVNYINILNDGKNRFATLDDTGLITKYGEWHVVEKELIWSSVNVRLRSVQTHTTNHSYNNGNRATNASNVSSAVDDDRVIAVPVENPNANNLVVITRGAHVERRGETTSAFGNPAILGPTKPSSFVEAKNGGRFSIVDTDTIIG